MSHLAQLLGLSPVSKLLIIHADDLGMCRSVNRAIFTALGEGAVSSASIMVPCPAFREASEYLARHAEYDIGIHSTLVSEQHDYKWRPVSKKCHGRSIADEKGYFWPSNDLLCASHEDIDEEISAQIVLAKEAGIRPTHLDSHKFSVARPGYISIYAKIGRRFGLPFLINHEWHSCCSADDPASAEDIVVDGLFQAHRKIPLVSLEDYYLSVLRELEPGLSQLIVHPGFDDPELRSITKDREAYGSAWRQRDLEIMCSERFKSVLQENAIHVINWGNIKAAMERNTRRNKDSSTRAPAPQGGQLRPIG